MEKNPNQENEDEEKTPLAARLEEWITDPEALREILEAIQKLAEDARGEDDEDETE